MKQCDDDKFDDGWSYMWEKCESVCDENKSNIFDWSKKQHSLTSKKQLSAKTRSPPGSRPDSQESSPGSPSRDGTKSTQASRSKSKRHDGLSERERFFEQQRAMENRNENANVFTDEDRKSRERERIAELGERYNFDCFVQLLCLSVSDLGSFDLILRQTGKDI